MKPGGPEKPTPIYNQQLLSLNPHADIVIVEGEKTAELVTPLLINQGIVTTTSVGGCSSAKHVDWTPLSGRRRIYICPDNDDPGMQYALEAAKKISQLFFPPEVYISEIPEVMQFGKGADLADTPFIEMANLPMGLIAAHAKPYCYKEQAKDRRPSVNYSTLKQFFNNPSLSVIGFYQNELRCDVKRVDGWQAVPCLCPFHPDATPGSFNIHSSGAFKCFSCQAGGGGLVKFVMLKQGCSSHQAIEYLSREYAPTVRKYYPDPSSQS